MSDTRVHLWLSRKLIQVTTSQSSLRQKEFIRVCFVCLFVFMATPMAYGRPQARDWIRASAAAYATGAATWDPLTPHCTGPGIEPSCYNQVLNPLCCIRNSSVFLSINKMEIWNNSNMHQELIYIIVLPWDETLYSFRTRLVSVHWYGKISKTDYIKEQNNDLIMFLKTHKFECISFFFEGWTIHN